MSEEQEDTKAVFDGFWVCRGSRRKDIVQAETATEANVIFNSINGFDAETIDPLTHNPYGHDVVTVVGEMAKRSTWITR
jgi:hypothetical protein